MAVSGTRLIYIPPSFGFGTEQHGVVPPNSRLIIGDCNAFLASEMLLIKFRHIRMPSRSRLPDLLVTGVSRSNVF